MSEKIDRVLTDWKRRGPGFGIKIMIIGALLLLFLIPLNMIEGLIWEREGRMEEAEQEISAGWGGPALMGGPVLTVPRRVRRQILDDQGRLLRTEEGRETVYLLPRSLVLDAGCRSEIKSRGIFDVPVYTLDVQGSGEFALAPLYRSGNPEDLIWEEARILFHSYSLRGMRDAGPLFWDGEQIRLESGGAGPSTFGAALSSPVDIGGGEAEGAVRTIPFRFHQKMQGAGSLDFLPLGERTLVRLESDWPAPSFRGYYLPGERELREDGFSAEWEVHALSRNVPEIWSSSEEQVFYSLEESRFGLDLYPPSGAYQKTRRTVDYALLFLLIPFLTFFLFELIGRIRIHPVQYLLAGCGDILFYLLLLSLSEHWAFPISYLGAAAAVSVMLSLYALSIRGIGRRALSLPLVLITGYGYLYFVLRSEDYALLLGSAGLFLALGAAMYLTRRVNWYGDQGEDR